jgi:hypothetical protein
MNKSTEYGLPDEADRIAHGGTPCQGEPHAVDGGSKERTGAPSSNTAPANCIESKDTKLLRVGVDSLYLSYHGTLSAEMAIRLETLKELARSKDPENVKLAQIQIGDHLFEVRDRGSFPYEFILVDSWYRIQIAGLRAEKAPLAHVKIASEPLTFEGPERVEEDLRAVVASLGLVEGPASVSRADLCVDFITDHDISSIREREWVTRARTFSRYTVSRQFSGWSIAAGSDLSARLYNKLLELEKSKKDYFLQIWSDLGWDGIQDVWRLESQYRRDVLRQLGVTDIHDLLRLLGGLWQYFAHEWLRLTCPDPSDTTQTRWPIHPMWGVLQGADWGVEQGCQREKPGTGRPPSERWLFVNSLSGITSFMALEGITDAGEGGKAYFAAARKYHDALEYLTGLTFQEYVEQKVALKARRYGSIHNQPSDGQPHPMNAAVAREYRRRSDGE